MKPSPMLELLKVALSQKKVRVEQTITWTDGRSVRLSISPLVALSFIDKPGIEVVENVGEQRAMTVPPTGEFTDVDEAVR